METDRIELAIGKIVQLEEKIPFPRHLSISHPIQLIKQAEQQAVTTHCMVCGLNRIPLEQHHIAGRINFPDTITVCRKCHDELTNIYQPKWLQIRNTERKPLEYYFLGLSDILHILWCKNANQYFYQLSKIFALNARYVP